MVDLYSLFMSNLKIEYIFTKQKLKPLRIVIVSQNKHLSCKQSRY